MPDQPDHAAVDRATQPRLSPDRAIDTLSAREREVLQLTATGKSNNEIAGSLSVTVHAVKYHLASIYRKLGAANRTEASTVFLTTTSASRTARRGAH